MISDVALPGQFQHCGHYKHHVIPNYLISGLESYPKEAIIYQNG